MQRYFDAAAGWVIIPTVGKGGIGIGGARGEGLLYDGSGNIIGEATMTQLTVGFQWGGQAYSQFMFFENEAALDKFKQGNYELGAQASAVAVTAGASADADFIDGVAIFTYAKGGLMYEATVGGQKFKVQDGRVTRQSKERTEAAAAPCRGGLFFCDPENPKTETRDKFQPLVRWHYVNFSMLAAI